MLQAPPAEVQPAPLPSHVWPGLAAARQAAARSGNPLLVLVPEDRTRRDAMRAFLSTLEGARFRSEAECWIAAPDDPEAQKLLDRFALRSRPALLLMEPKSTRLSAYRLGSECIPLPEAIGALLQSSEAVPPALLRAWAGASHPLEAFSRFAQARKRDLGAGAEAPYRDWLVDLLKDPDPRMRPWAAARLVEAGADVGPGEPAPGPVMMAFMTERFQEIVQQGNRRWSAGLPTTEREAAKSSTPPDPALGAADRLDPQAPCWKLWRRQLSSMEQPIIPVGLYALLAPELRQEDKTWVMKLARSGADATRDPWHLANFWLLTDWLLAYGAPADWTEADQACTSPAWKGALATIRREVERFPQFWEAPPTLQGIFCDGETEEAFWAHPDACLAQWGITREALIELGMERIAVKQQPAAPKYPAEAKRLGFSTTLVLRMVVGADGTVKWARPQPGYGLAFFAPTGLAFALRWTFDPVQVGGVNRPSQFRLTMPFKHPR